MKTRYKHVEGKPLIEVRIKNALQLFDVRDPAPFRERDLDDDFIEYVMSSAQEFSLSRPLKIVIYIEENESSALPKVAIREAIHSYLSYQIDLKRSDLKSFIRRAQVYLVIGLLSLAFCLSLAHNIPIENSIGLLAILREGLVIFGWVSIWKPIELMLYDWYPLYEKIRFYKKIFQTEVEIRFASRSE